MSKISRKILAAVTLSVSAIIVIFISFLEYKNYEKSFTLLKNEQKLITEGQAVLLPQYLVDKNEESIYLALTGIIANPIIVGVTISDDTGKEIFSIGETQPLPNAHQYSHAITYFAAGQVVKLGDITTFASTRLIIRSIWNRLYSLALMIAVLFAAITFVVAVTVRNVVDRPVNMLAKACGSKPETRPAELVWKTDDEMGLLISKFNELNWRLHDVFDGLRTELRDNEIMEAERLKCLVDATFEGIVIHKDGVILDANAAACELLKRQKQHIVGRKIEDCIGIEIGELTKRFKENGKNLLQKAIRPKSGAECIVELSSRKINYRGQDAFVVAIRDVTEQINSNKKIEFLAHYDHLTQISNRFKFHQDLDNGLRTGSGKSRSGAIFCLDLDGFKSVNDLNGHAAGDELLQQVGARLKSLIRKVDFVARLGGDEFAVAAFGPIGRIEARQIGRKFVNELGKPYAIDGVKIKIGASVGIVLFDSNSRSADELLKQADMALYEAKRTGKGRCQFYEPHMEMVRRRGLEVENRLRTALRDNLFDVHFQPQAHTQTDTIVGFEALARWNDPILARVAPMEFIPIAEQSGLILQLDEQVLRRACETAATWPGNHRVAVNLSPAEFIKSDLATTVKKILDNSQLDPRRLELEITESVLVHDEELAMRSIRQLKELGTTIAIDDFGTGYSSLSFLQRFPIDRIKIDKSFIRSMESQAEAALIVKSIIKLGDSLKIGVIAEGVETEGELSRLRLEDCAEVQGLYIGAPRAAAELEQYFQSEIADVRLVS